VPVRTLVFTEQGRASALASEPPPPAPSAYRGSLWVLHARSGARCSSL